MQVLDWGRKDFHVARDNQTKVRQLKTAIIMLFWSGNALNIDYVVNID